MPTQAEIHNAADILGVEFPCSRKALDNAFRRLVRVYHPDAVFAHGGNVEVAQEYMKEILAAKALLEESIDETGEPSYATPADAEMAAAFEKLRDFATRAEKARAQREDPIEQARRQAKQASARREYIEATAARAHRQLDTLQRFGGRKTRYSNYLKYTEERKLLFKALSSLAQAWRDDYLEHYDAYFLAEHALDEAESLLVDCGEPNVRANALSSVDNLMASARYSWTKTCSQEDAAFAKLAIEKAFDEADGKAHSDAGFLGTLFG